MSVARQKKKKKQRLIRLSEVMQRVGLSNSHIYALQAKGQFPKPIKLIQGGRASGYIESEIDTYIEDRITASRS